jgi:aspartyl-tRNA(Asn)/glutamyl-tRNA(Gln) amidotransferase subunit A
MALIDQTATELLGRLQASEVTSVELTQAFLDRIGQCDNKVKAFLRVDPPSALARAEEIDSRRKAGKPTGRLAGMPVAIKDLLCTKGEPTTCASRILEDFRPPYDATAIAKLKAADAVLIGKTNMDEFAMGGSNENSGFFPTHNPWDLSRIPGGSSGGAAASVAAQMAPLSVGSDTGGSIRTPAGLCGISGLKPTYGRVSRYGLVAFASSLDQIGPLGQTAQDVALLLEVLAGHDPLDSTSIDVPVPPYTQTIGKPLENLRIGMVREHFGEGLDPQVEAAVREAVRVYESLGATVKQISLPHGKYAVATYYVIAPCEASSNLARYDGVHYGHRTNEKEMVAELEAQRRELQKAGDSAAADKLDNALIRMYRRSRSEGFGPEVKRRIMLGTYALSAGYYDAYYKKALKVRRLIRRDFDRAFEEVDLIAGPVTPTPAFKLGEKVDDPLAMYLFDLYTVSTNLAGIGGMSIPCGFSSSGLPIGLHLQAPPFEEERLLRGAHMFQQATDWHTRKPAL